MNSLGNKLCWEIILILMFPSVTIRMEKNLSNWYPLSASDHPCNINTRTLKNLLKSPPRSEGYCELFIEREDLVHNRESRAKQGGSRTQQRVSCKARRVSYTTESLVQSKEGLVHNRESRAKQGGSRTRVSCKARRVSYLNFANVTFSQFLSYEGRF